MSVLAVLPLIFSLELSRDSGRPSNTFPVTALVVTQAQIDAINKSTTAAAANQEGSALVGGALRQWATQPANMIAIRAKGIDLKGTVPDQTIDDSCSHHIQALNNNFDGTLMHDSYLNGSLSLHRGQPPAIFAEAFIDNKLEVHTDARVSTGVKIFGHCNRIARDTVGITAESTGQTLIASELAAENVKIKMVNQSLSLVFNLNFTIQAEIMEWDVSKVIASHGCKLKILGITILSVCGWLGDEIKKHIDPLIHKVGTVEVPGLLQRLEEAVNAKIGDQIVIPLHKKQ